MVVPATGALSASATSTVWPVQVTIPRPTVAISSRVGTNRATSTKPEPQAIPGETAGSDTAVAAA